MKKFMKNKKGFTLVELLVVIAIIAILAAVVAPNAFKAIEKSKITAIEADYRAIKTATLVYYSDTGEWPEDEAAEAGFIKEARVASPGTQAEIDGWNGPYLDVWPAKSPFGTGYVFLNNTTTAPVTDAPIEAIYLKITDLPTTAYDRLKTDLGEAQVFQGTVAAEKSDVYLLIANK